MSSLQRFTNIQLCAYFSSQDIQYIGTEAHNNLPMLIQVEKLRFRPTINNNNEVFFSSQLIDLSYKHLLSAQSALSPGVAG